MMRPHVVKVRFATEAMTQEGARLMWLNGDDFTRTGAGLFEWKAECNAHNVGHAIEWAESKIREVIGEAAKLDMLGVTVDRLAE